MTTRQTHRHSALALSMACALMLPLAGRAQGDTREQRLEQRVAQLEQQLNELKGMIRAQQAAAPAAPAQNVPAAPTRPRTKWC